VLANQAAAGLTREQMPAFPPNATPGSGVTFEAAARRYMVVMAPRWGAHAAATTESIIRKHLIGHLGPRLVENLTFAEIQELIDKMVRNQASHSLLHKTVTHLRAILDLVMESGAIARNPLRSRTLRIEFKSLRPKSDRWLTLPECRALLVCCYGRDRLIVRLLLQLGLRPQEVFALRREDIGDESLRVDEVVGRSRVLEIRSGQALRNAYVPPDLMAELREYLSANPGEPGDWLFPGPPRRSGEVPPIGQNYYRNRFLKAVARRAGVPNLDFLALRRTFLAYVSQQGYVRLPSDRQEIPESLRNAVQAFEQDILFDTGPADEPS